MCLPIVFDVAICSVAPIRLRLASAGSFVSGVVSDRLFAGRRAPVAAGIYCLEMIVILGASQLTGTTAIAFAFVAVAFTVNSTHSLGLDHLRRMS